MAGYSGGAYVRAHGHEPLNMSYVLTASSVFSQTLERIVVGLNRAGFSRADFRAPDLVSNDSKPDFQTTKTGTPEPTKPQPGLFVTKTSEGDSEPFELSSSGGSEQSGEDFLESTLEAARQANAELVAATATNGGQHIPNDVRGAMELFSLRPEFVAEIKYLKLPQFYRKAPAGLIFADEDGGVLLDKSQLLDHEFRLADCDVKSRRDWACIA